MRSSALLPFLPGLAAAIAAPNMPGYSIVWQEDFVGSAGDSPDTSEWDMMDAIDTNGEEQSYTSHSRNVQLSGGSTLQIVPWKTTGGTWTSGRIESKDYWAPTKGKKFMIQASLGLGTNAEANKEGMWPAFWTMGQAIRTGTAWPECGELDIFEQVDGGMTGYGTAHCGTESGGPCDETNGLGGSVPLPDNGFHTWAIRIDRTETDWTTQTIEWLMDGDVYFTLTGATIGDQATWARLAHSPLYILLNVAVGGTWPGDADSDTEGGYGAMMEVEYVAVYST